ncbi:hypothetical protein GCM10017083_24230 [Thalassobaculum fulvum]|uniref:Dehydrogenase (Flavoprotein) n=1 Tax=Thalassobaculum fulvum TaxID=1633335 RepID=A0A918XSL1_9PROT|nr:glycine oxidase maturase GoxB [Thalassobaculum fulvum]GHD50689.1 hypothetical protein GCM10017083_24230 [Thalassobaculum fulvum]
MTDLGLADVAVVGGGIAGAAACVALHRAGLRSLWIAPASASGGDRVGESLAPAARPILAELGLDGLTERPGHRPANAAFSAWGTDRLVERNAIVHLEGPGRVLDRAGFEADLRAAADGSTGRCREQLAAVSCADGRWRLELAGGRSTTVRFLVDASGRASVVGRTLATSRRDDRLVAACAFLPHRDPKVEPTPATLIEAVEDGWWYAALLPDRRLSLAYFSDPDLLPRGLSRDLPAWQTSIAGSTYVSHWLADAGFDADRPPRLHSAGTTWLEPAAGTRDGAGWAAIGDAAAAFDPLSSHGMTTALWAAARIGKVAAAWLGGDPEPLSAYAHAVAAGISRFRAQRAEVYGREQRFPDAPFWRRRKPDGVTALPRR